MKHPWLWLVCALAASPPLAVAMPQEPARVVLLDDESELGAALASRTPPGDVAVRVAGISLPDADRSKVRALIVADVDAGQNGGALASVSYLVENDRGQVQARALRRCELSRVPTGHLLFSEAVSLPAGTYRVRLAVMRNNGIGVAQAGITARLSTAGPIRFGDLVAGEAAGADLAASFAFDRRVRGAQVVASLAFAAESNLPPDLTMAVEIAKSADGQAILSERATVLPGDGALRVAQAVLSLRSVPPGSYHLRLVAAIAGREIGRTSASLAIEAAPAGAAPRAFGKAAPAAPAGGFKPEQVLDLEVLKPFLDDLADRVAASSSRAAIDRARAGRFAEAAQSAASDRPDDPVRPFLQGLSLFSSRQLQAASEAFRETLRAAPDYFVGSFYIGACYAAGGRDPQAVNAWQTSLVGLDRYPIVFRLLGEAFVRMGQPERAIEALDEAHGKWPADAAITLGLARAALDARRYDRVIALTDATLTHPDPDLLFTGMQAVFEQFSQQHGDAQALERITRYRDLYVSAGGSRQALVAEWVAAVGKR
jgi:tetratricopeptide (TPR) repeat protein